MWGQIFSAAVLSSKTLLPETRGFQSDWGALSGVQCFAGKPLATNYCVSVNECCMRVSVCVRSFVSPSHRFDHNSLGWPQAPRSSLRPLPSTHTHLPFGKKYILCFVQYIWVYIMVISIVYFCCCAHMIYYVTPICVAVCAYYIVILCWVYVCVWWLLCCWQLPLRAVHTMDVWPSLRSLRAEHTMDVWPALPS